MARYGQFQAPLFFSAALAAFAGAACSKTDGTSGVTAQALGVAQAASATTAPEAATALAAAAKFQEAAFELTLVSAGPYKAGQVGQVEIRLSAKQPYHCNDKYPYKFKSKPSEGVVFEAPIVRTENGKLTKTELTLPVRFTPKAAGSTMIEGQFSFSVCTEDRCLVERRDLKLAVEVQ